MNKLQLAGKMPFYYNARTNGSNVILPISYTLGLTYQCNSRCKTCRIYDHSKVVLLTSLEWKQVFSKMGNIYWATFTGGEPFLRKEISEIYWYLTQICKPAIVNIPTNGLLTNRIVFAVWEMSKMSPQTKLIINVSLDHYEPDKNDEIRGVKGYYYNAVNTLNALQNIEADNLTVGIHTVISKYNVNEIGEISERLSRMLKDKTHYITEIAETRVELGTMELDITPSALEYQKAVSKLPYKKSLIQSLRSEYYSRVSSLLNGSNGYIPCYAGYISCQITPDGEIWFCCVQADSIGNLRDCDYDINRLWNSDKAKRLREQHKNCVCPLANVSYTNMLFHLPTMTKVIKRLV